MMIGIKVAYKFSFGPAAPAKETEDLTGQKPEQKRANDPRYERYQQSHVSSPFFPEPPDSSLRGHFQPAEETSQWTPAGLFLE